MQSPDGSATFLMTDVEGSTTLWERDADGTARSLFAHDALVRDIVEASGGRVVKARGEGDSHFAVFSRPLDAVGAAVGIQRSLYNMDWRGGPALRVRIAVHTGEALLRDGDYYGPTVNRCARLRAVAYGGQTIVSEATKLMLSNMSALGVKLRDLGTHRLKDLQRPERVYDVDDPLAPHPHLSIRSLSILPNNLPLTLTSFVGRDEDLISIKELIRSHRLVTMLGPGGTGKTRLALQLAAERADKFPGGVWFVALGGVADENAVLPAIATAIRHRGQSESDPLTELVACTELGKTLLVLDNCEHVLGTVTEFVSRVLNEVSDVTILTTSREALGLSAERVFVVPPLSCPPRGESDPDAALAYDSVRLFVERAHARSSTFTLNEHNTGAVADLCRAVEGLPLPLEFLASHVLSLAPQDLLRHLQEYLRPVGDVAAADARHRTMEDAIRWSYDNLSEEEQRLFLRLAVFVDGGNLPACESLGADVTGDASGVLPILERLVNKSLVNVEEGPRGEKRYRLLQPFRDFAFNQIGDDLASARQAHQRHYRRLAHRIADEIETDRQGYWFDVLDADLENLRLALEWTKTHDPAELPRFVFDIRLYWSRRGLLAEGLLWQERALALLDPNDKALHANLVNSIGTFHWRRGEFAQARAAYEATYALACEVGDRSLQAKSAHNAAVLQADEGLLDEARNNYLRSLATFRDLREEFSLGVALSNLGDLEATAGAFDKSIDYLLEALDLFRSIGNEAKVARAQYHLAYALLHSGDPGEAANAIMEALCIWMRIMDPSEFGEGLDLLSELAHRANRWEDAIWLIGASQAVLKTCGGSLPLWMQSAQAARLNALSAAHGRMKLERIRRESLGIQPASALTRAMEICGTLRPRVGQS